MIIHTIVAQLSADHEILKQVRGSAKLMVESGTLEENHSKLPQMVDFFLKFMEQYHHRKEEQIVFPLVDEGPQPLKAQIPQLLEEHRKAKQYTEEMKDALENNKLDIFAEAVSALVSHMYNHMGKEDTFIFPILLDVFHDPTRDLELMGKQEAFIKKEIGMDNLMRSGPDGPIPHFSIK
jgi:hemerythrin-like domain-containing protein